jgi:hypothetical protein
MKITIKGFAFLAVLTVLVAAACSSGPKSKIIELKNKGTEMGVASPDWIRTYTGYGMARLQSQATYRDKYCVIGEETGANLQFVQAWADNFSAQQRIGAMLRTTINAEYAARVRAAFPPATPPGKGVVEEENPHQPEIDDLLLAIVNVSYYGAQRENDWWSLRRHPDPEDKDAYTDIYTVYVLYTIPKIELNRQVAMAMETSIASDSSLYDITIDLAREILANGIPNWGVIEE